MNMVSILHPTHTIFCDLNIQSNTRRRIYPFTNHYRNFKEFICHIHLFLTLKQKVVFVCTAQVNYVLCNFTLSKDNHMRLMTTTTSMHSSLPQFTLVQQIVKQWGTYKMEVQLTSCIYQLQRKKIWPLNVRFFYHITND